MTSLLSVRLAAAFVGVGGAQLQPRRSTVADLTAALGPPSRVLPLYYKEVLQNTLYLYDELGIRFWAKNDVVTEWQLVLETKAADVFPKQAYTGALDYLGLALPVPLPGSLFATGQLPGFVLDTDAQQYGVTTYRRAGPPLTYKATLSRQTGNVATVSVS